MGLHADGRWQRGRPGRHTRRRLRMAFDALVLDAAGRSGAEFGGERRPGGGVVAGDQAVAALGGDALELADLLLADLRAGPDPAAHRDLTLDVLGQVGGVEGE